MSERPSGAEFGQWKQSKAQPADEELAFRAPTRTCNARLHRGSGYCEALAGADTDHPGVGRCRLHGGLSPTQDAPDGPLDLFRANGLDPIINAAQTMTHDDQEYLMEVGNNALVLVRAGILARMMKPDLSPKEQADLSISLQRIDNILQKYPDEENPDKAPNAPDLREEMEFDRLKAIEKAAKKRA